MRNPESGNNIPLNEPIHIYVPNVRKRLGLHPLREVISSDEESFSITRSLLCLNPTGQRAKN